MAVSFRVTGPWAELVADGSVAIPATPQAGDRMYLFARWKDFSVTAMVANWTALPEFADGAVGSGNGTGSVKVACWYRDWQSGDTDPTIDFSAAPENASVVIMVMQKGADEVWQTPIARTAAMTNWTTTPQIVSASATVAVPSDAVVMGLIGIRDDSATMTRPASGIDDSAGAITWNGNYVESPATHHSTTTGDDGAADLGYRLVAGGATATLRMTGTISAAETGAALWVVQGVSTLVTPSNATLVSATFGPSLRLAVIPLVASLVTAPFAPRLALGLTPGTQSLTTTSFAPVLNLQVTPSASSLTLSSFAPQLHEQTTPLVANLSLTTFASSLTLTITPLVASLIITPQVASLNYGIVIPNASLTVTSFAPSVLPFRIVFLDPGGDSVQAVGYFNTEFDVAATGLITFDTSQKVAGIGSWRFDSGATLQPTARVAGILGNARRVSAYFRYDSVPDKTETVVEFVSTTGAAYSDGGFSFLSGGDFSADNDLLPTATPAKNAGQGQVFSSLGLPVPIGAVIDVVKIIYERKYDVDTSIGISRVKTRVNGEEGPDHDNTDQPLTDTVVEVDVTADRGWTWQDLQDGVFEIIAEARRGDTDTEHTQSWDYVKVEVVYHLPTVILEARDTFDNLGFQIAITPKGAGVVLRFVAGDGDSFDGISPISINSDDRISFGFVQHAADNLDINIFLNSLLELSIEGASTGGFLDLVNLHYGWCLSPGANHICWFDQIAIDLGDDLSDIGDIRSTHKGPASVNENNWNTTIGTGPVDERPLSITNGKQHTSVTGVRQTYTLQEIDEGDVDLTGEVLVGYMVWAWAKLGGTDTGDTLALVVNNVEVNQNALISTSPSLLKFPVTSSVYPSHAAGIGMRSNDEASDTFLYECGAVQAYEGPDISPNRLLAYQLLAQDSVTELTDDLRADPPDTYDFKWQVSESGAQVMIEVYTVTSEGQEPQLRRIEQAGPGTSLIPIDNPGIEVSFVIRVTEASVSMGLRRFLNLT